MAMVLEKPKPISSDQIFVYVASLGCVFPVNVLTFSP
jgi:hypothetical protein